MIRPSRPKPELLIRLPLESHLEFVLVCETDADERRLRSWLRHSPTFRRLPALLEQLLDDLDDVDDVDDRDAA